MSEPVLALTGVRFGYPGRPLLFQSIDLEVRQGEFLVLGGPSGSGKSSILRLLCRLEEPLAGRVLYKGADAASMPPPLWRRKAAYVQQTPTVLDRSVRENLLLGFSFAACAGLTPPADAVLRRRLDGLKLDDVDLGQPAKGLSVGQKQRLCLIRSLLLEPEVLLLDEPTSALDGVSAGLVMETALEANAGGVGVVMVSHGQNAAPPLHAAAVMVAEGKAVRA